jgi:putative aldouronate transport system permease protein
MVRWHMAKREGITAFKLVNGLILLLIAFVCLLPFYYVITVSFSDPSLVKQGQIILYPKGFSIRAYNVILRQATFYNALKVSIIRTTLGTALNVALHCMVAYPLSRRMLFGRRFFTLYIVFTFLFFGGIIPTYLVVKYTGIINTIWALMIPNAIRAWYVIILISFFSSIPESIIDSAKIDGANDITILLKLIVPLSMPAIATITLFISVDHWNALMDAVIYINKSTLKPLQVYLMELILRTEMDDFLTEAEQDIPSLTIQTAAIFTATFPILLVYPFIQKYFIKGVMIGAIKG